MEREKMRKADLIRIMTVDVLLERREDMGFKELWKTLRELLGPIRQDFTKNSIAQRLSRVELIPGGTDVIVRLCKWENPERNLTTTEFVFRAVRKLRTPPHRGILARGSGFNNAFRKYFDLDPVKELEKLEVIGVAHTTLHPKIRKDVLVFIGPRPKRSSP